MGKERKVAIMMENQQTIPKGARGDQTVDSRTNRHPGSASQPIQLSCLKKDFAPQRRFDDREREHRLPRQTKTTLVLESLEDLLDDRKTGNDLVKIDNGVELKPARFPETSIQTEVSTRPRGSWREEASPLTSARSPSHRPLPASSRMRPARYRRR